MLSQKIVPGVMIAGKFFPNKEPDLYGKMNTNKQVLFKGQPVRISDVERFYRERENQRKFVQQMTLRKAKRYNDQCTACQQLDPDNCLYFDYLHDSVDSEETDELLDNNPFQNKYQKVLNKNNLNRCSSINNVKFKSQTAPKTFNKSQLATKSKKIHKITQLYPKHEKQRLLEQLECEKIKIMAENEIQQQQMFKSQISNNKHLVDELMYEKQKLSKAIVNANSREEFNLLKQKLQTNQVLIDSLLGREEDLLYKSNMLNNQQFNTQVAQTKNNIPDKEIKQPHLSLKDVQYDDDLEPARLQVNPEPFVTSSMGGSNSSNGKINQFTLKQIFNNAFSVFSTAQPKIVITAPFELSNQNIQYKQDTVQPNIVFNNVTFKLNQIQFISKIMKKFNNQLEKNVFWCCLLYILYKSSVLVKNKTLSTMINKITYQIPCQLINKPKCCFVKIYCIENQVYNTAIVGMPYFNDQVITSKLNRIKKVGNFDFEIEFPDDSNLQMIKLLKECVEKIAGSI